MEKCQSISDQEQFKRIKMLIGADALNRLVSSSVTIVGAGAVGSYVIEALARAGVSKINIIDHDIINSSNINRQLLATHGTIGKKKVSVATERIKEINPSAEINAIDMFVNGETVSKVFALNADLTIDAIDSLTPKFQLLKYAIEKNFPVVSSMGAALRTDPTKIRFAMLKDTYNCPLAKMLRKRFAKYKIKPTIPCVYSEEIINRENMAISDADEANSTQSSGRLRNTLGSLPTITGIFGLYIANYAIDFLSGYKTNTKGQ